MTFSGCACLFDRSPEFDHGPCYKAVCEAYLANPEPWLFTLRVWQDGELVVHETGGSQLHPFEALFLFADEWRHCSAMRSEARLYRGNHGRARNIPSTELVIESDIVPTARAKTRPQTIPDLSDIWRPFIEAKFSDPSSPKPVLL